MKVTGHCSLSLVITLVVAALAQAQPSFQGLGFRSGNQGNYATHVSDDGRVVIGNADFVQRVDSFRWTESNGFEFFGDVVGGFIGSFAFGVSSNGSVAVGFSYTALGERAMRWTSQYGIQEIPLFPGPAESAAFACSGNGAVIVGHWGENAFRWNANTGVDRTPVELFLAGIEEWAEPNRRMVAGRTFGAVVQWRSA